MEPERFGALWRSLEPIGLDPGGNGYVRYAWSGADLACRDWFTEEALDRDLEVESDGNGNVWAWWGEPTDGDCVVTGSHFDSVPHGGPYDGPLGIVSGFLAIDLLRDRGVSPLRPIGIAAFVEEEGSRFGVACLGSRLLTGAIDPSTARALVDRDGLTLARALTAAGDDPSSLGPDAERVARVTAYVELHIEQGRALAEVGAPVGVASAIWPHGRWRLDFGGEANHAGTTRMVDRRDPVLTFAATVLAAEQEARHASALATVGRVAVEPNATNAIAARVTAWLDARAPNESTLDKLVETIRARAHERAEHDRTTFAMAPESLSPVIEFDTVLRDRLVAVLGRSMVDTPSGVPVLPTGAGHDAGVLAAAGVPTAMLFVRNPTGISHAAREHASDEDCAAGVTALAAVLEDLACR